jgi:hypothetical protein
MPAKVLVGNYVSTSLTVAIGTGAQVGLGVQTPTLFPDTSSTAAELLLTLTDGTGAYEIVSATNNIASTGGLVTTARGLEGTQPLAWAVGTSLSMRITAGMLAHANAGSLVSLDTVGASPTVPSGLFARTTNAFAEVANGTVPAATVAPTVIGSVAGEHLVRTATVVVSARYGAQPTAAITAATLPTILVAGTALPATPTPVLYNDPVLQPANSIATPFGYSAPLNSVWTATYPLDVISDGTPAVGFDGTTTLLTTGDNTWLGFSVTVYLELMSLV